MKKLAGRGPGRIKEDCCVGEKDHVMGCIETNGGAGGVGNGCVNGCDEEEQVASGEDVVMSSHREERGAGGTGKKGINMIRVPEDQMEISVRVRTFLSAPDGGPKTWIMHRIIHIYVDPKDYSIDWLINDAAKGVQWGSNQKITFWFSEDGSYDSFVQVTTDIHLLELLEAIVTNLKT